MSTLSVLAIQSKGTAILIIILLLLVAALISYLTAWLYTRSVYEKKIKIIESEKDELKNQITNLNTKIDDLEANLSEKEDEIKKLKSKQ